jgi:hypothetical protein
MTTELHEALLASDATAFDPKVIDALVLEYVRRYSPLLAALPSKDINSTTWWFNTRTALPNGGAVKDGGGRPLTHSTYTQASAVIKLFQVVGGVTGYAQKIASTLTDLYAQEVRGASQSLAFNLETHLLFGSAGATAGGQYPTFDGFDIQVSQFSGLAQNTIDEAHATLTLPMLDKLIDMVETQSAMPIESAPWMFTVSGSAVSKVAQLMQNQQRFVNMVEVVPGLIVPSYRNVPFVKSSYLNARQYAMGAVTPTTATTGGTLAAATYRYSVSAIIDKFGETAGSVEVTQATTGATSTATLTFATPTGPDAQTPILYKVFRSTGGAGTPTLLGYVDAFDAAGTATTSIVDNGATLLPNGTANASITSYVATNAGQFAKGANDESIFLIARDEDYVVRPYVRDVHQVDLAQTKDAPDVKPFAILTDTTLAVRASKYVGRLDRVAVSV